MKKSRFFFSSRRRHTSYWRDWSSDVCSSDLHLVHGAERRPHLARRHARPDARLHHHEHLGDRRHVVVLPSTSASLSAAAFFGGTSRPRERLIWAKGGTRAC